MALRPWSGHTQGSCCDCNSETCGSEHPHTLLPPPLVIAESPSRGSPMLLKARGCGPHLSSLEAQALEKTLSPGCSSQTVLLTNSISREREQMAPLVQSRGKTKSVWEVRAR